MAIIDIIFVHQSSCIQYEQSEHFLKDLFSEFYRNWFMFFPTRVLK